MKEIKNILPEYSKIEQDEIDNRNYLNQFKNHYDIQLDRMRIFGIDRIYAYLKILPQKELFYSSSNKQEEKELKEKLNLISLQLKELNKNKQG